MREDEISKNLLRALGAISSGAEEVKNLRHHPARHQDVDIGAAAQGQVAIECFGQRHTLQGDDRDARTVQQRQHTYQLFGEEGITKGVDPAQRFQVCANLRGHPGKAKPAEVAEEKGMHLLPRGSLKE